MSIATVPAGLTVGTYTIDPSHSQATFSVRHAGIAKVRGTVDITQGTVTVAEDLTASSVSVTLDPATVDTKDANRDGHLKSADFFEVEKFPEWTFVSTSVEADGEDYVVHGDLTIHGVTRPVALRTEFNGAATDPFGNARVGFSATTSISRKDFELTWNAALETGGVLVGDKVTIELEVSAIRG